MSTIKDVRKWADALRQGWREMGRYSDHDVRRLLEELDSATITTIDPKQQAVLDAAVRVHTTKRVNCYRCGVVGFEGRYGDDAALKELNAAVDAMTRPPSVADRLEALDKRIPYQNAEIAAEWNALIAEARALEAGK